MVTLYYIYIVLVDTVYTYIIGLYSKVESFIQQKQIIDIVMCYPLIFSLYCCFQSNKKSHRQQGRFIIFQNARKTMTHMVYNECYKKKMYYLQ